MPDSYQNPLYPQRPDTAGTLPYEAPALEPIGLPNEETLGGACKSQTSSAVDTVPCTACYDLGS